MNRSFVKYAFCLVFSGLLASAYVLAEDSLQSNSYGNDYNNVLYVYRHNYIPLKQPTVSKSMAPAVAKYNKGDYLGAMVDLQDVVKKEENNTYAKYYLALCYTQLGYKNKAQETYDEVLKDNSNYALSYYSKRAVTCINDPDSDICKPPKRATVPPNEKVGDGDSQGDESNAFQNDITKFINSGKKIHPAAMDKITREKMERKMQADIYKQETERNNAENR